MRLTVVAVGRWRRDSPERALFETYAARLPAGLELVEVAERRPLPAAELKAAEAALIARKLPSRATLVALDAGGTALGSEDLARHLAGWSEAAFVVGGAEGLDESLLGRADLVWSLGPATWPHMLVRAMLAEQLYRAFCINSGHPYHRA